MTRLLPLVAAAAALVCGSAHAAQVTSLPGSTLYDFGTAELFTAGPVTVAPGITWSSLSASSVYGYSGGYGFDSNGTWGTGLSMIGTNSPDATMRIDFATAVSGVGAFLNWSRKPEGLPNGSPAMIAAYDAADNLLESYTLTFGPVAFVNGGEFHGFLRGSADIASLRFSGSYIGAANLEVVAAPVPEPGTYALMLAGLGVVAVVARRRKGVGAAA